MMTQALNSSQLAQLSSAIQRQNFYLFMKQGFASTHPGRTLSEDDYLEALGFALQNTVETPGGRLMVTMPPRYLKSFAASVALPAWLIGKNPTLKIVVATYADGLAQDHARQFRRLILSGHYQRVFPGLATQNLTGSLLNCVTRGGGGRRAVTVGGTVTGLGADILIVDDIMKASDATSDVRREEARRFFDETLYTRLNNKAEGQIIVVGQRLHQDDIIAHLAERQTFENLNLPAIAESETTHQLYNGYVWNRDRGEVLARNHEDANALERIKADMGESAFRTQYQQDPASAGSAMLNAEKLTLLSRKDLPDAWLHIVQTWDTAIKDGPNCDYSVGMAFGWDDTRWVLLDVVRRRMNFADLKVAARRFCTKWSAARVLVEDSANGSALVLDLRKEKLPFKTLSVKGSKEERFAIAAEYLETGKIALLEDAPYFQDLRRELLSFPTGRHDVQVDALSLFVRRLRLPRPLFPKKR
ncbi:MAG: phage terminase large subunit [Pseudomonadota bacterium]